jgi:hypothetical protein
MTVSSVSTSETKKMDSNQDDRVVVATEKEQTAMAKQVGGLMQEAQTMLLQKTVECGCNAVLSITCNVSTDSSGDDGNSKLVVVTMIGTPCVIMPASEMPVVNAQARLVPDFQW